MTLSRDDIGALEAERAALLRSLDDLDHERAAGELEPDEHARLRDEYTARAAAVIRSIERATGDGEEARAGDEAEVGAEPAPSGRPARSARRLVATVFAVLAFAGLTSFAVSRALGERGAGETASGNSLRNEPDRRAAYQDEVDRRPDDPLAHLAFARYLLGAGDSVKALEEFDAVTRLDPGNAEAHAYGGWIVFLAGLADDALARLDAAVAADPAYPDARFFRGMVLYRGKGDPAAAIPELQRYLAADPTGPLAEQVRAVLAMAVEETGQQPFLGDGSGATGP